MKRFLLLALLAAPAFAQLLPQAPNVCIAASNSGTAYTCGTVPVFTPQKGTVLFFEADVANTGSATLAANGVSGTIRKLGGSAALIANDLLANEWVAMIFDGVYWQKQWAPTGSTTIATGTVIITAAATALTCTTNTATATGATTAMAVVASPAGTADADVFIGQAYVSTANTVTVQICTRVTDASAPAITYNWRVIQ
jgi:hypothetical protein